MRRAFWHVLAVSTVLLAPLEAWSDSHGVEARARIADGAQGDPRWSEVEKRVWEDIVSGRQVKLSGPCPDWQAGDGQTTGDTDPSDYTLGGLFLRQILGGEPFQAYTADRPIGISGARIVGDVVVEGGRSQASLTLACSTFEGGIRFVAREMERPLRLLSVQMTGSFVLDDVHARSDVTVERSDLAALRTVQSRIDGTFSLRGSQIRDTMVVASTEVGHGPVLGCRDGPIGTVADDCRARYGKTDFRSMEARRMMTLDRSVFLEELGLQEVDIGGSLLARGAVFSKGIELLGGTIEGRVQMDGSASGEIYLEGVTVHDSIHLRGGIYPDVALIGVDVGRDVDFRKSKLKRLNLSGTSVPGALRLGAPGEEVDWRSLAGPRTAQWNGVLVEIIGGDPQFIARNTRVSTLQDTKETWPKWVGREFDGFEYEKLGRAGGMRRTLLRICGARHGSKSGLAPTSRTRHNHTGS